MNYLLVGSILLGVTGCGSDEPNNVEACEDFVASVKCGDTDISGIVTCSAFANTACNIADYFECLSNKFVCVNEMYDEALLATLGECVPLSMCN